jgi:hypothetical protein
MSLARLSEDIAEAAQLNVPLNTWTRINLVGYDLGGAGDCRWTYDQAHDAFVMFGCDGQKNCDRCTDGVTCCRSCDGYERGGYRRTTWIYSLPERRWWNAVDDTPPNGYPAGRCQAAHVYDPVTGHVYFRGGASSRGTTQTCPNGETYVWGKLWRFNFDGRTWTDLAPADPSDVETWSWGGNRWMAVNVPQRKFYVVNLSRWQDHTNVYAYDIPTNTWTRQSSCLIGAANCPDLVRQSREETSTGPLIYDEGTGLLILKLNDGTWRHNVATSTWTKSTSATEPYAQGYIGFVYVKEWRVSILIGAGTGYDQTWAYNAVTDTWTQTAAFPARQQYGGSYGQFTYAYSTKDNVIAIWGNEPGGGDGYPTWVYRYADVGGGGTPPDTLAPAAPTNLRVQ